MIQLQVVTTDLANAANLASIKANTVSLIVAESGGMITASDIFDVLIGTSVNRRRVRRQSLAISVTVVMKETVPLFATTAVAESIQSAADATELGVGFDVDGFNFVIGAVEKVIATSTSASAATPDAGGKVTPATAAPSVGVANSVGKSAKTSAHVHATYATAALSAGVAHKDADLVSPAKHTLFQVMVGMAAFVGVVAVAKRMRDQSRFHKLRVVDQPGETEPIMQAHRPNPTYH
jgi:hypothetical protein